MYVSVKKCLGKRTCKFSAVAAKIFFPQVSSLERNVIILGIKMCPHLHSSQRSFSQASSAVGALENFLNQINSRRNKTEKTFSPSCRKGLLGYSLTASYRKQWQ